MFFVANYKALGKQKTHELVPDGKNMQVTERNKHKYIEWVF